MNNEKLIELLKKVDEQEVQDQILFLADSLSKKLEMSAGVLASNSTCGRNDTCSNNGYCYDNYSCSGNANCNAKS